MTNTTPTQRLVLTNRDLQIMQSLSEARFITAEALEWLHFPTWPQNWRKWQAKCEADPQYKKKYLPSSRLYDRLRRLEQHKYILRIYRPIALAVSTIQRDADLYALAERGAQALAEYGGLDYDTIHYEEPRVRSSATLPHSAEIGRVYAALRAKIEGVEGLQFAHWQGDHITAREYDHVEAQVPQVGGGKKSMKLPVQPDGTFKLIHPTGEVRCFVEVDRGRSIRSWREKIYAYRRYASSPELQGRYGTTNFVLLTITNTPNQRQKLMEATAQILERPSDYYLFNLIADVHPMRIGTWLKSTKVSVGTVQQIGGVIGSQVEIETGVHPFIR